MVMLDDKAIRELRNRTGLTMLEFGRLIGVSESTVSFWESGDRHPAWKHLVKLNDLAAKAEKNGASNGHKRHTKQPA